MLVKPTFQIGISYDGEVKFNNSQYFFMYYFYNYNYILIHSKAKDGIQIQFLIKCIL